MSTRNHVKTHEIKDSGNMSRVCDAAHNKVIKKIVNTEIIIYNRREKKVILPSLIFALYCG